MESGKAAEYKNKNLDEIDIDINQVFVEEDADNTNDDAKSDQIGK